MNKLFLILLPAHLDRDKVITHLASSGAINFWFYNLPYSFFVRSHLNAPQLQNEILKGFKTELILIVNIKTGMDFSGIVPDNQAQYFSNIF